MMTRQLPSGWRRHTEKNIPWVGSRTAGARPVIVNGPVVNPRSLARATAAIAGCQSSTNGSIPSGRARKRALVLPGPGAKLTPSSAKYSRNAARMPCSTEALANARSEEATESRVTSGECDGGVVAGAAQAVAKNVIAAATPDLAVGRIALPDWRCVVEIRAHCAPPRQRRGSARYNSPLSHAFLLMLPRYRRLLLLAVAILAVPALAQTTLPAAVPPPPIAAKAYLLVDLVSGQTLAADNADAPREPASLTKLMTAYIVFRALKDKEVTPSQMVNVSEKAWRAEGSRMFIEPKKAVTVDELLHGVIVQSGNDASIALAETVAGSEDAFADRMNREAARLGMKNTHFVN